MSADAAVKQNKSAQILQRHSKEKFVPNIDIYRSEGLPTCSKARWRNDCGFVVVTIEIGGAKMRKWERNSWHGDSYSAMRKPIKAVGQASFLIGAT